MGKVSPILVTLTSRIDSDFERSKFSLKENKPDDVDPNFNDLDYYVRKNEGKFYGFRQTELVYCIIIYIFIISQLWLTSRPRSTVVPL